MSETKNASSTAVRWCTYPGNTTEMVGKQLVGPNTLGEKLTPVVAVYDEVSDRTRVGFAYGDHRTNDVAVSS